MIKGICLLLLFGFQMSYGMNGNGRKKAPTLLFSKVVAFNYQETKAYTYYQAFIKNGDYSVNAIRFPDGTYDCYGFSENQSNGDKQRDSLNMTDAAAFNTLQRSYKEWESNGARIGNDILADTLQTIDEQREGDEG